MNEDKLRELSEDIPIPEKLKPENIEKMLLNKNNVIQPKRHTKKLVTRIALSAASFLLLFCVGSYMFSSGLLTFHADALDKEDFTTPAPQKEIASNEDNSNYVKARNRIAKYLKENDYHYREDSSLGIMAEAENSVTSAGSVPKTSVQNKASSSAMTDSTTGNNTQDYSGTNIQVEGVDEGDIVKTDGTHIYVCSNESFGGEITVYKADGKDTKKISTVVVNSVDISEIYIRDKKLVVISSDWTDSSDETKVSIYDVTDIENPKHVFTDKQSGHYSNSRMNGNYLYTISTMRVTSAKIYNRKKKYIPSVSNKLIPEENLCIPKDVFSDTYLVITSLNISDGKTFTDNLAVLGGDGICYTSEKNIYIAAPSTKDYSKTVINKFSYKDGDLKSLNETTFRGKILNQFSMDEYKGNLRFVATTNTLRGNTSNGLYVLDENMELIGSVDKLAKDERIYSARFMGEKAYFVTYRETDPVFLVDLSDPKHPVVKDELKIPGFSEYLHAFGNGLMLGIGSNETSGDEQVKLTMFDISSDTEVTEKHTKLLEEGTYSQASQNHKAILVSPEKNLIGFAVDTYSENMDTTYRLFSYNKEKGFKELGILNPTHLELMSARGLYIGDYFYLADGNGMDGISVYKMKTWEKVAIVH